MPASSAGPSLSGQKQVALPNPPSKVRLVSIKSLSMPQRYALEAARSSPTIWGIDKRKRCPLVAPRLNAVAEVPLLAAELAAPARHAAPRRLDQPMMRADRRQTGVVRHRSHSSVNSGTSA